MTAGTKIISAARTITEADIVAYAGFSGDFAPVHVDEEYAKQTPFGTRILHGCGTLAVCNGLIVQSGAFDGHIAFLGLQLKLPKPVKPGDTLRVEITELSRRDDSSGTRQIIKFGIQGVNQRDEVVLDAEWTQMGTKDGNG